MPERIVQYPTKLRPPYETTPFHEGMIAAVKSLYVGNANAEQQIAAMEWIVKHLCGVGDPAYFPESARDSDFAAGKRWVGIQLNNLREYKSASKDSAA